MPGLSTTAIKNEALLDLVESPQHAAVMADRVQVLLVDEFQDTSPIQLAVFLRLAALAHHTVWVGDPKQAIYGFRGADPELMAACLEAFPSSAAHHVLSCCALAGDPGVARLQRAVPGPESALPCAPQPPKRSCLAAL